MTSEEAINVIKQVNDIIQNTNSWLETAKNPVNESLNMAIKAIEENTKLKEAIGKIKTDIENSARYTLGRDYLLSYDAVMNIIEERTEGLV